MWIDKRRGYKSRVGEPELMGKGVRESALGTTNSRYNVVV